MLLSRTTRSTFGLPFSAIVALPFAAFLATPAIAHTYLVGPGPGSDFPDIPSAIAGAQAGDVLVVRQGSYAGGFTLDKGLTILGQSPVILSGPASITDIAQGQRAVVVGLSVAGFQVDSCTGPVVLQDLTSAYSATISASTDVRLLRTNVHVVDPASPAVPALTISDTRVEVVDSLLQGADGVWNSLNAAPGLRCILGSRVQVVRCDVIGGNGSNTNGQWWYVAGDGASAVEASGFSELFLAGSGQGTAVAGDPGLNLGNDYCCQDGEGFAAVSISTGVVRYSGFEFHPSYSHPQSGSPGGAWCCQYDSLPSIQGPSQAATPDDPTLSISGTPTNGGSVTLTVTGPAGSHAWLELGRQLAIVPDPDSPIEELVDPISTLDLGTIPASGQASFVFGMPGFVGTRRYQLLPPGAFFAAQGLVTLPVGGRVRTNSIPIVGR